MSRARRCVAVDLGAESGRVVVGTYDGSGLQTEIVHRFPNVPRQRDGALRWDFQALWEQVQAGLGSAAQAGAIDSVGVDTWGIDYGYLDEQGQIVGDPVHHRDPRTRGAFGVARERVGSRLYRETGTQVMHINTVFQLLAETREGTRPAGARTLLMVPDLFHHVLSGARVAEFTAVSTTGAFDMARRAWATGLLADLGIPTDALPEVVDAGTDLGPLLPAVADSAPGLRDARVITPGSHDTASAVAAVPLEGDRAAYVSSGTWSLVGVERREPVIDEASEAANLTNEGGVAGTVRLLRNVMGLWILQECRRQWEREGEVVTYDRLVELAAGAPAHRAVIDVDHPAFVEPGDMPGRLRQYCRATGQHVPESTAELARAVLEGLALRYRKALDDIARVTGAAATSLHIVGGGARNALLDQFAADATATPVHAGPVEATAMGNVLVQLAALGELGGLADMREVVRSSERPREFAPAPSQAAPWEDAYGRLHELAAKAPPDFFD